MPRCTPHFVPSLLSLALMSISASALAQATPGYERGAAQVLRAEAGRALADARQGTPSQAVAAALGARGRDAATLGALRAVSSRNGRAGASHLLLEQVVDGLAVHGAYAKAAFNAQGDLVHLIDHLAAIPPSATAAGLRAPQVDAQQALATAMAQLHPKAGATMRLAGQSGNTWRFEGSAFFHSAPTVTAVAVPHNDGSLARGWLVQTWSQRGNQLHHTLVSGQGQVLDVESRSANDSYNIFPIDPSRGPQALVNGPGAGNAQSPNGWLNASAQTSINIVGNNASAYLDVDANNAADAGGTVVSTATFNTAANLTQTPATTANRAVAVQNLFYLNNLIHDRLYRHGFDEAAGNFQVNNFGLGGLGNDAVNAEAQDGSGTDNANMSTPADGQRPRMQMFLWTGAGATHEVLVSSPLSANYGAMGAAFGPALTTTGLAGAVVAGSPADGCARMTAAVNGKVALIDRGTCDFTVKVLNAQNAGATGVIIANNAPTPIFSLGGSSTRVRIPSVMISQADGAALRGLAAPNATLRKKAVQPLQLDASLDSGIVYHEYCHGLTWRMIGSMSGAISGAIGEGMSDVCAMLINGDDVVGAYSASNALGIRRYRYAGYPLTYRDVTGAGVHNDGEIYGAIGWRLIELFGGARRDDLFGHIVQGMNFTPAAPSFEAMRDGILSAVAASATPADRCTVWGAFAQYGVGVGSKATVKRGVVTVTESFAKPADCP